MAKIFHTISDSEELDYNKDYSYNQKEYNEDYMLENICKAKINV